LFALFTFFMLYTTLASCTKTRVWVAARGMPIGGLSLTRKRDPAESTSLALSLLKKNGN
jgi:hypothetical protein